MVTLKCFWKTRNQRFFFKRKNKFDIHGTFCDKTKHDLQFFFIYFLAWLSLVLFLGVSSLMMSKLLFLLSILRVTFENSVGLDIITGCLSFNFFILRLWLLFFVVELRFGAVEGFLWFVVVSDTGMVEPKAVVVVVSPELTLILVSKASTSCPDY